MTLADNLTDWTDSDGAAYELGRALGLFAGRTFLDVKGVFWDNNPLGNGLHDALLLLVRAGVLEVRDGEDQFRWNPTAGQPWAEV
ncbi:hypothetical protein [Virgisporangium ochraceum]|uniref:hypothetical protein n=1 Tax=Virgisporangium ochraceum TaxID=65505 RepID=UPI0019451AA9|nr:hypothetical protein [Virgisporangium ochraceum]